MLVFVSCVFLCVFLFWRVCVGGHSAELEAEAWEPARFACAAAPGQVEENESQNFKNCGEARRPRCFAHLRPAMAGQAAGGLKGIFRDAACCTRKAARFATVQESVLLNLSFASLFEMPKRPRVASQGNLQRPC